MNQPTLKQTEIQSKALWAGRSVDARLAHMPNVFVNHDKFKRITDHIKSRTKRCIRQKKGASIAVLVPTGAGKSTLVKHLCELWPDKHNPEITLKRVVSIGVPSRPSAATMSIGTLATMGHPVNYQKDPATRQRIMIDLLVKCKTRLILLDNAHDIPERRLTKGVREVGNWIRDVIDAVPALFVTLGEEVSSEVTKANRQVRRRIPGQLRIDYFECTTDAGRKRMKLFMHKVDMQLPLAEMSGLSRGELVLRMQMASNGIVDYIIKILTESVDIAVRAGREHLTQDDLAKGFDQVFMDAAPDQNPFDPATEIRRFDLEGEPFHKWLEDGYE